MLDISQLSPRKQSEREQNSSSPSKSQVLNQDKQTRCLAPEREPGCASGKGVTPGNNTASTQNSISP